jgi:hypothetical protein
MPAARTSLRVPLASEFHSVCAPIEIEENLVLTLSEEETTCEYPSSEDSEE